MNANITTELLMVFKCFLAAVFGAMVGWQRERRGREAGVRTFAAVTMGACTFGIISTYITHDTDVTRIASQVVTGIGFLGAGVIMRREEGRIAGLTTAASLWASAGIGLAVAFDMYIIAFFDTLLLIVILYLPHPPAKGNGSERRTKFFADFGGNSKAQQQDQDDENH